MGTDTKDSVRIKLPAIKGLTDVDALKNQVIDLLAIIDAEEDRLLGGQEFPHDALQEIGTLSYEELICYDNNTLEQYIWELNEIVRRIDIQSNRIDKILNWLNGKLSKAIAMMPPGLLDYKTQEEKYQLLALEYPVVRYLLDERDDYQRQTLHWRNLNKDMDKKCWSLKYRLEQLNKLENDHE
jgi:hypothetical protein